MKNRFKLLLGATLTAGIMLLSCTSVFAETVYISTADELTAFKTRVNGGESSLDGELTADIEFNGGSATSSSTGATSWAGIGQSKSIPYKGTFNGNGHTISGLYYSSSTGANRGLFGYVDGGTIKNVILDKSYIYGKYYVGGIVGYGIDVTIENCINRAEIKTRWYGAGGILGYAYSGNITITNCANEGTISAAKDSNNESYAGGILGREYDKAVATISYCRNTGAISGTGKYIGGIAGYVNRAVTSSYSTGTVTGGSYVGSLVGRKNGGTSAVNCGYVGSSAFGDGTTDGATAVTTDQVKSGALCYILNGSVQGGTNWYQTIGTDDYPVTDSTHGKVYFSATQRCPNDTAGASYNNTSGNVSSSATDHTYSNGVCIYCGTEQALTIDSATNSYLIANEIQLASFVKLVNSGSTTANATLTADITLNSGTLSESSTSGLTVWTPISSYAGTFNGNGHTISGLYYSSSSNNSGMFSSLSQAGTIKNLTIDNSLVLCDNASYVGLLCGTNNGTITDCTVSGTVKGASYVGGLSGINSGKTTNSAFNGTVSGTSYIGGLFGANYRYVLQSSSTGKVTATSSVAGGLVGYNNSSVSSCYTTAETTIGTSSSNAGAVVGTNTTSGNVSACYYLNGSTAVASNSGTAEAEKKASTAFSSGEVCYLLNKGATDTNYWRQTLNTDSYPVGDSTHKIVYITGKQLCPDYIEASGYNNSAESVTVVNTAHTYDSTTGLCKYCSGANEPELVNGYYEISDYAQLVWFAKQVATSTSINGKLVANITANSGTVTADCTDAISWSPIGTSGYYGTFDGQGYTISGLYCKNSSTYAGLFAVNYGTIKNVNITNSYFYGSGAVGAISAKNGGTITACSSTAQVEGSTASETYVGGICGDNSTTSSTVQYCYSKGSVNGSVSGGVIGKNVGKLLNSYSLATVSGTSNAGIICGMSYSGSVVNTCYYVLGTGKAIGSQNGTIINVSGLVENSFKNGTVCYLLNGSSSASPVFYQTIGTDESPVLDSTHSVVSKTSAFDIGDVNTDGVVDKVDVAVILRYVSGADTKSINSDYADVSGDGKVDMLDAIALSKKVS